MDTTWVDIAIRFISTLGFPIVVACWFMWKDYKLTSKFISTLDGLKTAVEALSEQIKNQKPG